MFRRVPETNRAVLDNYAFSIVDFQLDGEDTLYCPLSVINLHGYGAF